MGRCPRLTTPRELPRSQSHGSYVFCLPYTLRLSLPPADTVYPAVGRWQKNIDLNWYAKGDKSAAAISAAEARKEEIRRIKEAEESALSEALGYGPTIKSNANETPIGKKEVERAIKETAGGDEEDEAKGVGFGAFIGGLPVNEEVDGLDGPFIGAVAVNEVVDVVDGGVMGGLPVNEEALGGEGLDRPVVEVKRERGKYGDGRKDKKRRSRSRDRSRERRHRRHTYDEKRSHKRRRSRDTSHHRMTNRSRERHSYRRERSRSYNGRDDERTVRRRQKRSHSPDMHRRRREPRDRDYDYRR